MLIEQIKNDLLAARISKDPSKGVLTAFYAEAGRIGKDKRNGLSTDDEVIVVGKKFITNASDTAKMLADKGLDNSSYLKEIEIISKYVPVQLSSDELKESISAIISELNASGPKFMGQIMSKLKEKHGNTYDGKTASNIIKELLS